MTDPAFESYDCGSVVVGIEPFRWDEVERELDGLEGEEAETARRMVGRALYMIVSLLSQHREPRMICDLMIRELNADKEPLETIAVRYGTTKQAVDKEQDKLAAFFRAR